MLKRQNMERHLQIQIIYTYHLVGLQLGAKAIKHEKCRYVKATQFDILVATVICVKTYECGAPFTNADHLHILFGRPSTWRKKLLSLKCVGT